MLPEDLTSTKPNESVEEQKVSKERLSALLCVNANGSHRLKAVIVGKHRWPCVVSKCSHQLPVHYYHNPNAWFTWDIVQDWFFKHAEPEIRRFQVEDLKIAPSDVCALILMDRAPVHLDSHALSSHDGRIKCLLIPPNVSLAQPMEQGIILSTKRLYRKKFLDEVLILPEEIADGDHDIQEIRPLTNIKNYSLKAAIFNFADAWRDMPQSTLTNSWKRLLSNSDVQWEMEGIEVADFLKTFTAVGRTGVTESIVFAWLEEDEVDPGYQMLTEEEIVKDVLQSRGKGNPDDDNDEALQGKKRIKLSTIRNHCDIILAYLDTSEDPALQDYYEQFRNFRQIIIQRQQRNTSQMDVHSFFRPREATLPPNTSGPSA
uniref:DDE-1 domain-containing protein n=1 Tax=Scylla olivacea TaxID=85551 RepID=A0A0P4WKS8_SCYOL